MNRFPSPKDYNLEKSCVKQLMKELSPIDCANTQVAVIQYGANDQIVHKFSDNQDIDTISGKIDSIVQTDIQFTGTRPEVAIETSLNYIFQPEHGSRSKSSQQAKEVIVLITDGKFERPTMAFEVTFNSNTFSQLN